VLWPIFVIYGLSGYAVYVWQRAKGKRVSIIPLDDADDDLHR
jgi:CDP-diacylglycerol--serine O-phosphatidyltransferase